MALCDSTQIALCLAGIADGGIDGLIHSTFRKYPQGVLGLGTGLTIAIGKATLATPIDTLYNDRGKGIDSGDCDEKKSPLVINLSGSGLHLSRPTRGVAFDVDGDGILDRISWTTDEQTGFLALDRNGNGQIDDGRELFGDSTPIAAGKAANGFEALAALDTDGDGKLSPTDRTFDALVLWLDSDHDGKSQTHELRHLADLGILELPLTYRNVGRTDRYGNEIRQEGTVDVSGRSVPVYDVWLRAH